MPPKTKPKTKSKKESKQSSKGLAPPPLPSTTVTLTGLSRLLGTKNKPSTGKKNEDVELKIEDLDEKLLKSRHGFEFKSSYMGKTKICKLRLEALDKEIARYRSECGF